MDAHITRRRFLQIGAAAGAGLMIPLKFADKVVAFNVAGQGLPLAPGSLPKYVDRLPTLDVIDARSGPKWSVYEIQAVATKVVPSSGMAAAVAAAGHAYPAEGTTFWSYRKAGSTSVIDGLGDTYLGPAFVVQKSNPIKIRWFNNLKDSLGNPIKHPLAVDPSLHWAAVPAGDNMTVSYTHLRAHETRHDLVCRLLLE